MTTNSESSQLLSVYSKLKDGETRIVLLQPGKLLDPIICYLKIINLARKDHYEALSYTWGNPKPLYDITLNGHVHGVPGNLLAALHRLRLPSEVRSIWIDALSINQLDTSERNLQVTMMGSIYKQTTECLVFLDQYEDLDLSLPQDELRHMQIFKSQPGITYIAADGAQRKLIPTQETLRVVNRLEPEYLDISTVALLYLMTFTGDELLNLPIFEVNSDQMWSVKPQYERLFSRLGQWFSSPWWRRMWVIQECLLPRKVSIIFGTQLVPWKVLLDAANALYKVALLPHTQITSKAISPRHNLSLLNTSYRTILTNITTSVLELESSRIINNQGNEMGALTLLWTHRHRLASDPRDHIYALCSFHHMKSVRIMPDYTLSTGDTYINHTQHMIQQTRSLQMLVGAGLGKSTTELNLPSWVQDWSFKNACTESQHGPYQYLATLCHRAASIESWYLERSEYSATKVFRSILSFTSEGRNQVLSLQGREIDTITAVGSPMPRHTPPSPTSTPSDFTSIISSWRALASTYTNIEAFWRTINCGLQFKKGGRILGVQGNDWARKVFTPMPRHVPSYLSRLTGPETQMDGHPAFATVQLLARERRFFVNKQKGLCGLGPVEARVGDKVFLLPFAGVPFVLRPVGGGAGGVGDGGDGGDNRTRYQLVGECYVEGVMQGESLRDRLAARHNWQLVEMVKKWLDCWIELV